jgi:parallel beta-helix repeat protein
MQQLFLICHLVFGSLFAISQTTIYVSPTGVSGNAGTLASPKDINSVFDSEAIGANTIVILLDGIYTFKGDRYLWKKQGSISQPLIIKAKNKHKAILKGNVEYASNRYAVLFLAGCKHVVIDGLTVMHEEGSADQQAGINIATASGGSPVYSEYVTVKNCKIYGHGAGGIASSATDNIKIQNNIVYGNCRRSALNTSGISIYKPKANTADSNYWGMIISGNICYDNKCEINFYYNEHGKIYEKNSPTDGNGIILDLFDNDQGNPPYGKRVLVENNLCYNNGGAGIKSFKSSLARIVNNTCYHNNSVLNLYGNTAQIIMFETGGVNGNYHEGVYNNIAQTDLNLTTHNDFAIMVDFDMNKVYNNFLIGKGAKFKNYKFSEEEFSKENIFIDGGNQDAAKFQNVSIKNFKPKKNSPLLDKYTGTAGPVKDINGTSRPQGGSTDLGCYEYIKEKRRQ